MGERWGDDEVSFIEISSRAASFVCKARLPSKATHSFQRKFKVFFED